MKFFFKSDFYRGSSWYLSWNLQILCLWSTHSLVLFSIGSRIIIFLCMRYCASAWSGWESCRNFTSFHGIRLKMDWAGLRFSGQLCTEPEKRRCVAPGCDCFSSLYFMLLDFLPPSPPPVNLRSGPTDSSDSSRGYWVCYWSRAHKPQTLTFSWNLLEYFKWDLMAASKKLKLQQNRPVAAPGLFFMW